MAVKYLFALISFLLILMPSQGQQEEPAPWADQQQKLTPAHAPFDPENPDFFGRVLTMNGDIAIIGAPLADVNGVANAGVVYVFQRVGTQWTEKTRITAPEPGVTNFGGAVAFDGNTLAISALPGGILRREKLIESAVKGQPSIYETSRQTDNKDGIVYVYNLIGENWIYDTSFQDDTPSVEDAYGAAIAIAGDTLVVSADDTYVDGQPYAGVIHIYQRENGVWRFETSFSSPSVSGWGHFSMGLDLDAAGDTLVVGTLYELAAYVYQRLPEGWTFQQKLHAAPDVGFVYAAAISITPDGNTIAAGSPYEFTEHGKQTGAVDIFAYNGTVWMLEQKVIPPDTTMLNSFGAIIDVDEDALIVSAGWEPATEYNVAGAAYVFFKTEGIWSQQARLVSFDLEGFDEYSGLGSAVAINGEYALVGAWNGSAWYSTAYAYKIPGVEQELPSLVNTDGLLSLPKAETTGASTFQVSLKTRPTKDVKLRLKTDGAALLDNGGIASDKLILRFSRDNWNVPQTVRVRGGAEPTSALVTQISYKVKGSSAVEYLWVTPPDIQMAIPEDQFGLLTPLDGAVLSSSPYVFTWRPYTLATHYTFKLISSDGSYEFKQNLTPSEICTPEVCTFTMDQALSTQTEYQWRIVAKDKPAEFKKKSPLRSFSLS